MKMNNNKGFSLVELMVVVAIIGILAAVAIPNFKSFQRKSRQSEGKSNLTALFDANMAYIAEHDQLYDNIESLGYAPYGDLRYNVGWRDGAPTEPQPNSDINAPLSNVSSTAGWCAHVASQATCTTGVAAAAVPLPGTTGAVANGGGAGVAPTFIIGAAGWIGGTNFDELAMTHTKNLTSTQNGIN